MTLTAGTHLGAYEVIGSLGAGGMGEVYRARDTRLTRDVALKIIPDAFSLDADRLARFQREAQVLASLNHPNIAAIYGLEEAAGVKALVLELVDGETLADRIARGPVPLDEALPLARQIAEALESAHEQGVIHRDLKPANIKVREDGAVKVLDFGLAKILENDSLTGSSSLSLSPTITTPAMTQIGMILGTAAYMAPEQARGKSADRRSDVWAFGCVLFEMLTGQQAFAGEDVTDVIAAVVRGEPAWHALPADTPLSIRLLLQRCLEKDRRKRVGDVAGVLFVLREPALVTPATPVPETVAHTTPKTRSWRLVAAITMGVVAAAGIAAASVWTLMRAEPPRPSRLVMVTGEQQIARNANGRHVAIAPDGSTVAYISTVAGVPAIYVRRLDSYDAGAIAQPAAFPFFRPDGKEIGFVSQGSLRRVAITGGPSVEIARLEGQLRGAAWGSDNRIIFAATGKENGLLRIPVGGGQPEVLTKAATGFNHVLPQFLPDEKAVLFTIAGGGVAGNSQIAILDLRSSPPQSRILIRGGSDAHYLSSGHILYLAGDSLRVVPFDLARLTVTEDTATPVLAGVAVLAGGVAADFDVSATGALAYLRPSSANAGARSFAWVDRSGREQPVSAPPRPYLYPRLSPDGTRLAVDVREGDSDIMVWDLQRGGFTRVTRDPGVDRTPVWANNEEIFFSSMAEGAPMIFRQRADGTGKPEKIAEAIGQPLFPVSMVGNRLIVSSTPSGPAAGDLMTVDRLPAAGETPGSAPSLPTAQSKLQPLVQGPAGELNGSVSPDGRWLAYQSNESGTWEVYVQPFGAGASGPRATVSTMGGQQPRWSPGGQELFFVSPRNEMMVVTVRGKNTWTATPPERLFDGSKYFFGTTGGNPYFNYDIARDGRFLVLKPVGDASAGQPAPDHIMIVQHWTEELKRISGR